MQRIVFVEFRDGKPFQVITSNGQGFDYYNLDYCKHYGAMIYSAVGWGSIRPITVSPATTGRYWAAQGVQIEGGEGKRLKRLPRRYTTRKLFQDAIENDGPSIYCSVCADVILHDDPCDHVHYCEDCETWSTPGEQCPHHESENR